MSLWYELLPVVGVWAGITIFAVFIHQDISTHFSLLHFLDFLVEFKSLLFVVELLLLGACCFGWYRKAREVITLLWMVMICSLLGEREVAPAIIYRLRIDKLAFRCSGKGWRKINLLSHILILFVGMAAIGASIVGGGLWWWCISILVKTFLFFKIADTALEKCCLLIRYLILSKYISLRFVKFASISRYLFISITQVPLFFERWKNIAILQELWISCGLALKRITV